MPTQPILSYFLLALIWKSFHLSAVSVAIPEIQIYVLVLLTWCLVPRIWCLRRNGEAPPEKAKFRFPVPILNIRNIRISSLFHGPEKSQFWRAALPKRQFSLPETCLRWVVLTTLAKHPESPELHCSLGLSEVSVNACPPPGCNEW